ncbi:hypothetical protein JQS43_11730 [Natronosporangium hydrolyticum]|uniref:Glycosidase n=1 Tax=Natronosporangium hydrolyticum TaxID=2811111 RepID=A0A895YLP2_9ACTN|nr:hypothetical protein [Natronosporangium hydrolyticum]QSB16885.1 hypothetical protein JQS43_11730 [Natronosporangium hydrolyticum]
MVAEPTAARLDGAGELTDLFTRSSHNPLLTAADWPYPANSVLNPAAAQADDETVLVCRVEDRRGISHLSVARSSDGETGWRVDPLPLIGPAVHGEQSRWGVEDPRLTWLADQACWALTYTAYGPAGPAVAIATTTDFRAVTSLGVVLPAEDKNASLLPERVGGDYLIFHRPMSVAPGRADVWCSRSPDLRSWRDPRLVLSTRPGAWWDHQRVGMGPPPLRTPHGWLGLYHGIKELAGGKVYRMGVVLLDLLDPAIVLRRGDDWVLGPATGYERTGDAPNVVFPTGLVHDPGRDRLRVYYGAADTCVAMASAGYSELLDYVLACPEPDPRRPW